MIQQFIYRYCLWVFLLIAALFGPHTGLRANHLSGTSLSYEHLSGDMYRVTLMVFLNCGESPLSNILSVSAMSTCGFTNADLLLVASEEVSQLCTSELSNSGCNGGSLPGVELRKYQGDITLPPCSDWEIFRSLCNRTSTENVDNSLFPCYRVSAFLDNSLQDNSSPVITVLNIPYVCVGHEVQFNAGFFDNDGDSLTYSLVAGTDETNNDIIYSGAYSGSEPITGITINSQTGQIEFTPVTLGRFTVVIEVREYRNGQYIGRVRHDFLFIVEACAAGPPVFSAAGVQHVSGGGYPMNENTIGACAGDNLCFSYSISSTSPAAVLSISSNVSQILPGSTVVVSGTNPATVEVCTTLPANFSSAEIILSAFDNSCPIYGQNHRVVRIVTRQPLSAGADTLVCAGAPVQLTAQNSASYLWHSIVGEALSASNSSCTTCDNPVFNFQQPTTVVVTGAYPNSTCANSDTVVVSLALEVDTLVTPDACTQGSGAIAIDVLTGSGSYTVVWDDSPSTALVRFGLSQGAYTVHITDNVLLCTKTLNFVVDDHFPLPQNAGPDTSVCGSEFQFQPDLSPYTGTWTGPTGSVFSDASDAFGMVTVPAPGTYTFVRTITDSMGCVASDEVMVNFLALPQINAGNDTAFCGLGGALNAMYSGGTITWNSTSVSIDNIHSPVINLTATDYGAYEAVAVIHNGTCFNSDTVQVSFTEIPLAQAPADTIICGNTLELTGTASTGSGEWLPAANIQWQDVSDSTATAVAASPGNYQIVWQVTNLGCSSADTVSVAFAQIPEISNIDDSILVCGTSFNLFPEFSVGTPLWQYTTNLQVDSLNPGEYLFTGEYGVHPVEVTLATAHCEVATDFTLNFIEMPVPEMPDAFSVCGFSTQLSAVVSADTVYWLSQSGIAFGNAGAAETSVTASEYGSYTFTLVAGNADFCYASETVAVTFLAPPVADAGPDISFCSGSTAVLGAPGNSGYVYSWSGGEGLEETASAQPQVNLVNSTMFPLTQVYSLLVTADECTAADTVTVTVNPLPEISINASANICTGEATTVTAIGGINHQWYPAQFFASPTAASTQLNLPFSQIIVLQGTSPAGCVNSDTTFITVHDKPQALFTADVTEGCMPLKVKFTRAGANSGENSACQWNFGNGWSSTSCGNTDTEYKAAGNFTPSLKVTSVYGCVNHYFLSEPIVVGEAKARFSMEPEELDVNNSQAFFQNLSGSHTVAFWEIGNSFEFNGPQMQYTFPDERGAEYQVCLTVVDTLGCMDEACKKVKVEDDFFIYVPTAFSPNGDGLNDLFFPVIENPDVRDYHFWVTDRKGMLVFETNDIHEKWNGSGSDPDYFSGNAMYLWHVTVKPDFNAAIRSYNGTVMLVR